MKMSALYLLLLPLLTLCVPDTASNPSVAFRCPFSIMSDGTIKPDPIDPEEEEDEEAMSRRNDISWCLPKTYLMERPPFGGKTISPSTLLYFFLRNRRYWTAFILFPWILLPNVIMVGLRHPLFQIMCLLPLCILYLLCNTDQGRAKSLNKLFNCDITST